MRLFMRKRRWLLSAAGAFLMLALAGCGGDENPTGGGGGGGGANCTSEATCKQVTIESQVWMAENLNIATPSGSWCYGGDNSNCAKYGRLYDWATAKTVCPSGWHLPSREEWGTLAKAAGGTGDYGDGGTAGTKLKSKTGWDKNTNGSSGDGTDDYGFSALPGGNGHTGSFDKVGVSGFWWTASEDEIGWAHYRGMYRSDKAVFEGSNPVEGGFSVRCLRD